MKKILIIQGNPVSGSYSDALAAAYQEGAIQSGAEVRLIRLGDLQFNPVLTGGYRDKLPLEEDLIAASQSIQWADHLVFVYPIWWGSVPSLLKGFIDRVILPGFAFKYHKGKALPEKLLKGKTARLITTMDGPIWYHRFIQGQPGNRMMKQVILEFCGVKPVRITSFGEVGKSSAPQREQWLQKVKGIGRQLH